jgi:cytochrome c peroxidase
MLTAAGTTAFAQKEDVSAAAKIGERIFSDERFAQLYASGGVRAGSQNSIKPMSCRSCHFADRGGNGANSPALAAVAFADRAARSPIPERGDGRRVAPRNSPTLVDALEPFSEPPLLHFDAEFASAEELVRETFLGRNFGWLPDERAAALRHFVRVIREDEGTNIGGGTLPRLSYSSLLRGNQSAADAERLLPAALRIDPARVSDEELIDACARLVVAFLRTLRFSRDADGRHNGSPYDAFLAANRLPRGRAQGQSAAEYGRRIAEQIAALRVPRFVDEPDRALLYHANQRFRFGELELQGMRIFFRSAIGQEQRSGAGNCAECHVPPHFTDFKFHNTGVTQDEYDALHGEGAFAGLEIPDAAARNTDYNRWLPPTPQHPNAIGPFLSPASAASGRTDLGLWNIYGNPDLPASQPALERLFPAAHLSRDAALARTVARFKTSSVRNLGHSAPYQHNGGLESIEEVIGFYERMAVLAQTGKLRNAPPELSSMRLKSEDVAPLAAFLRSLNEDYVGLHRP